MLDAISKCFSSGEYLVKGGAALAIGGGATAAVAAFAQYFFEVNAVAVIAAGGTMAAVGGVVVLTGVALYSLAGALSFLGIFKVVIDLFN